MKEGMKLAILGTLLGVTSPAIAQEAVVGVANPDALFFSKDPVLNRNKQAAYHIVKDLLEANHWELTAKWLGPTYIQHNPQVKNGLQPVIDYFTKTLALKPTPIPVKMKTQLVSVVAEGDKVIVAYVIPVKDSKDPTKIYTTTTFDMWRFENGKAVEHWDVHTKDD
ncbi:hypothetical protein [uncultured Sphingomonas sp.]|uniref:nuclear transport factor 2 family protein n=1 Tax=uncultured Sphingomonas sp. TaxID=158754 RepID=UPI0035C95DDF